MKRGFGVLNALWLLYEASIGVHRTQWFFSRSIFSQFLFHGFQNFIGRMEYIENTISKIIGLVWKFT